MPGDGIRGKKENRDGGGGGRHLCWPQDILIAANVFATRDERFSRGSFLAMKSIDETRFHFDSEWLYNVR